MTPMALLPVVACRCAGDLGTPEADLIFQGGTIHAADRTTSGLAIVDGEVAALGDDAVEWEGPDTEVVDLAGGHAFPGFQDAHVHLLAGSFVLDRLLLTGVSSMDVMVEQVADYAALAPDEPWIVGYGWVQEGLGQDTDEEPDGRRLDEVVSDRPVLLANNSGHSAIVNAVALERAGITADTPDPEGGEIAHDPETGEPTGYLLENALSLVSEAALGDYDDAALASGLATALDSFAAGGLVGAAEILASPGFDLSRPWIYADLEAQGELPIRIHWYAPVFEVDGVARAAEARDALPDGTLVRFAGVKLWVDGSMGTAESWMKEPLEGTTDATGSHYFEPEELVEIVREAEALEMTVKMHANGDAAVDAALDAFETVDAESGLQLQHVLDHVVLVSDEDRARMAAMGVVASVQPGHYLGARLGDTADAWGDRFDDAYDFRAFQDEGVPLAMGTDWPVWPTPDVPVNVWAATQAAAGHELTAEEALWGYSAGSARAVGRTDLGCLDVGCAADVVVFDQDPGAIEAAAVSEVQVLQVWVAGKRVR